jgi:DUF4097 and DUF4098 domain-containing protein YvlB
MNFTKTTLMVLRLSCLMLFVASAFGAEKVNRKMDAAPAGQVTIENTAGTINVTGWAQNEVEVSGELGRDVEELVFERNGNSIVIRVESRQRNNRRISSDLAIRVPENSSVNVSGVSTDIGVRNVRGELRLSSISGDISSEVFEADIDVETVSGDIQVNGKERHATSQFSSVSGDIDVKGLAGAIAITSVSGDIAITGGSFERVNAQTTSGDIDYRSGLIGNGRMDIETINGDLEVICEGDVSARFDIETFNGSIRNCFGPEPERTSRYTPGRELKFAEGGGTSRVTIRTLNGDLRLCRD